MAKHEFGIMMNTPRQSERYDEYEPWKYECISVDDKDLEGVVERLSSIDFYWHTLSVKAFIDSIADIPELCELKKLLKRHWTKINGLFITEFD